jgi:hypothetical protein
MNFDLHVATELTSSNNLARALEALGLHHDQLVGRKVNFYNNVMVSACPLIGLHMSKKYDNLPNSQIGCQMSLDMQEIERLLKQYGETGYAHTEVTPAGFDQTIRSQAPFRSMIPWPVAKFSPTFSGKNKKWDIHVAIPLDHLPNELETVLEASGMYSIDLVKKREGLEKVFRVYTIQSTSSPCTGQALYAVLVDWFQAIKAPYIEIKQETYVQMFRVGDPLIVPPTIEQVCLLDNVAALPSGQRSLLAVG